MDYADFSSNDTRWTHPAFEAGSAAHLCNGTGMEKPTNPYSTEPEKSYWEAGYQFSSDMYHDSMDHE